MRQITPEGRRQIELDEGLPGGKPALKAYLDSAGVPTIGFGHTKGVRMGDRCTTAEASAMLDGDLDEAERAVDTKVRVPLNDWQFAALVSFVFNVGVAAFASSSLLRRLNAGDYAAVPGELMKWVKARDPKTGKRVTVPGLVNRRSHEIATWSKGARAIVALAAPPVQATTRPEPPPAPTRVLDTSTGKAQATALVAGGTAAAAEVAGKTFGDNLKDVIDQLAGLAWAFDAIKYALVGGTLVLIAWTLWDKRRKVRSGEA